MDPDESNYAQDDPAFQLYATEAANIIEGLRLGDGDGLNALPGRYQQSLRDRMYKAAADLAANNIGQDLFDQEIRAMVSIACFGLREVAEGE